MTTALRAAGLRHDEKVLTNGFTLAPVPGSIVAAGGRPVLVEITEDLVIDLDDLAAKIAESGARFLLLSNMRGHLADMDVLSALLTERAVMLVEDCAHTMGARWNGRRSGSFGLAGCFSTQTYKHMNSGEGGLLTSDDPALMAQATILSGSYMLYERHGASPPPTHSTRSAWNAEHVRTDGQPPRRAPASAIGHARAQYRPLERALPDRRALARHGRSVSRAGPARGGALRRVFYPVLGARDRRRSRPRFRR